MSGNNVFLDTNIVLYLLAGDRTVADLLLEKNIFISFVTELELLGYKGITVEESQRIENFLSEVTILDINSEIKRATINLRRNFNLKLPDAIISATSQYLNFPLLTSDKALGKITQLEIILYEK